jgi:hypothetical protein
MATEIEYVNYKDFVAGLETTENPGVDDVTVVSNETDGPRVAPANTSALSNAATVSDVAAGNAVELQTSEGKKKLDAGTLLQVTAQNALGSIKNLSTTINSFRTGDVIPVDGPSGTAKMIVSTLLKIARASVTNTNLTGAISFASNDTNAVRSSSFDYPCLSLSITKSSANYYAGIICKSNLKMIVATANTIIAIVHNKQNTPVTFNLCFSQYDYSWSSQTLVTKVTLNAGEFKYVPFEVNSTLRGWSNDNVSFVCRLDNDCSISYDLDLSLFSDVDYNGVAPKAYYSERSKKADVIETLKRVPPVYSSLLNGGSYVRGEIYGELTPSSTTLYYLSFNIKTYVAESKKLAFAIKVPDGDTAKYLNKLVVTNSAGDWTSPVKTFADGMSKLKTTSLKVFELDLSDIAYDENNQYYLMVGGQWVSGTARPIYFTFFDESYLTDIVSSANLITDVSAPLTSDYITCWGDSLTALGGWTGVLQTKSGIPLYNCGVGGENSKDIIARQGGDIMMLFTSDNPNIVIPATTDAVEIRTNNIKTLFGNYAHPLAQPGGYVNPVTLNGIKGTLSLSSSKYYFTRSEAGEAKTIDRDARIVTYGDVKYNSPYLMIIFIGQNGGWSDAAELIDQHNKMIAHSSAKHVLVLGLSSGTTESRADYEAAMKAEFGRYFVSIRQYLAHPIYDENNQIVSCYGLADEGLTPSANDLEKIAIGQVPSQLLADGVHYTDATKTVIGNMLYKYCQDLGIF